MVGCFFNVNFNNHFIFHIISAWRNKCVNFNNLIQKFGLKLLISLDCAWRSSSTSASSASRPDPWSGIPYVFRSSLHTFLLWTTYPAQWLGFWQLRHSDFSGSWRTFKAIIILGHCLDLLRQSVFRALPRLVATVFFLYHEYSSFDPLLTAPIATG